MPQPSLKVKLLREAHDRHLYARALPGSDGLLQTFSSLGSVIRGDCEQAAFRELLVEGNLVRIRTLAGRDGSQGITVFSPSRQGQDLLRQTALAKDWDIQITQCHWRCSPRSLTWALPMDAWEVYKGEIHGALHTAASSSEGVAATLAEVDLVKLNQAATRQSGFDMHEAFVSTPELDGYETLVPARAHHDSPDADDLLENAGHGGLVGGSLLIVLRIQVRSAFLGLGLGREIIGRLARRYMPEGGLIAVRPMPLQFAGSAEASEGHFEEAQESLRNYYLRLGFVSHPHDPGILVCDPVASRALASLFKSD